MLSRVHLKKITINVLRMIVKLGDIVQILGVPEGSGDGVNEVEPEYWYGEVVGKIENAFEVYYIKNSGDFWEFEEDYHIAEKECINNVIRTKHGDYTKAWAGFGFIYRQGPPISLLEDPNFNSECSTSDSESLDTCDSWSSSDDETNVSELIDDSEVKIGNETSCASPSFGEGIFSPRTLE